jgi:hypothetical protein
MILDHPLAKGHGAWGTRAAIWQKAQIVARMVRDVVNVRQYLPSTLTGWRILLNLEA